MEAINFTNLYKDFECIKYPIYSQKRQNIKNNNSEYLKSLVIALKNSIKSEKEDEEFYTFLLTLTSDEKNKNIIKSIIADEIKHAEILKKIYFDLTEKKYEDDRISNEDDNFLNYRKNLEKALFGELEAIKRYRNIMKDMPDKEKYSDIMEILTDEIRHSSMFNYLISLSI